MCYTYDELNRVKTRTIKDLNGNVLSEESFNYDAAGNITAANEFDFAYDTNNRLTEYLGHAVEYDADGNMLSNSRYTLEYDSANRLVKACNNIYTYNAEDIRIRNVYGEYDTTYTYNTNCKLSQLLCKTTNGITTKYVYGLGLIGQEKENEFKTYHFDYRGSTVAITEINGTITDTFKYNTYGKLIERTGDSFIIFGYNGRDGVITDNNGLIYMRARYYSPDMRRFVNADILHGEISDSTSLNRYSYVNGNPVSYVDPFGLSPDEGRGVNTANAGTFNEILNNIKNQKIRNDYLNSLKLNRLQNILKSISKVVNIKVFDYYEQYLIDYSTGTYAYYSVESTLGEGDIEIWNIALQHKDFLNSEFVFGDITSMRTFSTGQFGITLTSQINDYTSVSASLSGNAVGAVDASYTLTTNDNYNNSTSTTFGFKTNYNHRKSTKQQLAELQTLSTEVLFALSIYAFALLDDWYTGGAGVINNILPAEEVVRTTTNLFDTLNYAF